MAKKISITNSALIIFTATLLLSVYAQISYQSQMWSNIEPSYVIDADKLSQKPDNYFVLSNPDQYVLTLLNGQENHVYVHCNDTQIDELVNQFDTSNIEYNGSYYTIGIAFVDAFPPLTQPHILAGFVISILGIVVIAIFQGVKHFKAPIK